MPIVSRAKPVNSSLDSDEDDEDYVPLGQVSSESDSSEVENGDGPTKQVARKDSLEEIKQRKREALWASFQESVANSPVRKAPERLFVKVEKRFRFAGEDVTEVVEVPEDSPDAKKWPLWTGESMNASSIPSSEPHATCSTSIKDEETKNLESGSSPSLTAIEVKPQAKRPGPRKPKTSLAAIPGPAKAKKLTTLDKSAMDWRSHLQTQQELGSSITEELEANRKAGGYLSKVEFLKRVEDRKEENLDAIKSNKRRKL